MRYTSSIIVLFFVSASLHAEPKEIADLIPADALFFAEIHQPGAVAKDLAAFLKGSIFEKTRLPLQQLRANEGRGSGINTSAGGMLAALLSPEMLKEATTFKGVALAITDLDSQGQPEYLAIVLSGDSALPGLLMRGYLAANGNIGKVTTMEGIDIYRERSLQISDGTSSTIPIQPIDLSGPHYAYAPGLVVAGCNREQVAAVIRRFKAKEKSPAISSTASFKLFQEQRTQPGIHFLADPRRLLERNAVTSKNGTDRESLTTAIFKKLLPPQQLGTMLGRLEIKDDSIRLNATLKLAGKSAGPLADLLEGAVLQAADLASLSTESPLVFTLALPAGNQRVPRLLQTLDTIVKATGTLGPTASEILHELEEKQVLTAVHLAQVQRLTFALRSPVDPKIREPGLPTITLDLEAPEAAATLESAVPMILELLGGTKADAVTETIKGMKIRTLSAGTTPIGKQIHYGRNGKSIAISDDRLSVANALRKDTSTNAKFLGEVIQGPTKPGAALLWNWSAEERPAIVQKKTDGPRRGTVFNEQVTHGYWPRSPGIPEPIAYRIPRELVQSMNGMPPLVVTLGRHGDELRLTIQQADPQRNRVKAIDSWFEWFARVTSQPGYRGNLYQAVEIDADILPPLVPPPPLPINPPQ